MRERLSVVSRQCPGRGPEAQGPKFAGRKREFLGMNGKRLFSVSSLCLFASVSLLCLCPAACGKKTPVRPPAFVLPEPTGDLALDVEKGSVVLRWGRPQQYVDGTEMDDLAGFVVLRASQDAQGNTSAFTKVATVPVEDRDRFRKAKRFNYTDTQLTAGTLYRYRVQSFTLDGYSSEPSNTLELVWKVRP
jgi:hypothetical protein